MTPRKLSDSDKNQIVELYRQPGETTLTLANQYGVSNTTISRILKSTLPAGEYEGLIQQKRVASRNPETPSRESEEVPVQGSILEIPVPEVEEIPEPEPTPLAASISLDSASERVVAAPIRRSRKRSSAESEAEAPVEEISEVVKELTTAPVVKKALVTANELESEAEAPVEEISEVVKELTTAPVVKKVLVTANELNLAEVAPAFQELADEDEDDDDLDDLDDDLEEGLDDDLDGDFDDEESGALLPSLQLNSASLVRVLPLTEAAIPKTCYLVVDRAAELIARPLKEFGELGQIPSEEIQEKTLPVFDNHRVAKRFSNIRTQRVIKIPDSSILQKAASHLQAKGITRLLIDGQVYAW